MAPQGSSTLAMWSKNHTPAQTRNPAISPMSAAAHGDTKADGAVIATSPASIPLHDIEMSGLPYLNPVNAMAAAAPNTDAVSVLTMITAMRRSLAPSVDPGLKPIQPNRRMNVP